MIWGVKCVMATLRAIPAVERHAFRGATPPPGRVRAQNVASATYYCALGGIPSERRDDLSKRRLRRPLTFEGSRNARASFNLRFNDNWTAETLKEAILVRLAQAAGNRRLRPGASGDVAWEISWRDRPSPCFLTRDDALSGALSDSVEAVTGRRPKLSTSGGTSDARFIKDYCPVVEFGLVGQTMHMVDENVALEDLETLTEIYRRFIADWMRRHAIE